MTINIDALLEIPASLTMGRSYEQVLIDARALLADSTRWTQEAYARDELGNPVRPKDPRACCWCVLGAVAWSSNEHGIIPPPLINYLEEMVKYKFGRDRFGGTGSMNDYVNHEAIISFLDETIEQFRR